MVVKNLVLNAENDATNQVPEQKQWYETLWGLAIITVGLNILSNFIYDRGRAQLRLSDKSKERLKDIDFLTTYEGKTQKQAEELVDKEQEKVDKEIY